MSMHPLETMVGILARYGNPSHSVEYRWSEVSGFLQAINYHRHANIHPSDGICIDESISRRYGLGGYWTDIGLPHFFHLQRKPEAGCELNSACCCTSWIMIRLDLTKCVIETSENDYEEKKGTWNSDNPSLFLETWFHTNRDACGD